MLTINRRTFLQGSVGGAVGLVLGCDEDGQVQTVEMIDDPNAIEGGETAMVEADMDDLMEPDTSLPESSTTALVNWIHISPDNIVEISMHKAEMGQGVNTSLPLIIAEELDVAASQIKVKIVAELDAFNLGTGLPLTYGSTSIMNAFTKLRTLGASAKALTAKHSPPHKLTSTAAGLTGGSLPQQPWGSEPLWYWCQNPSTLYCL